MGQETDHRLLRRAFSLAEESVRLGGDPFGAVLALDGRIVMESVDESVGLSDPTFHAELAAISKFCRKERVFDLSGYTLYCLAEPCVICSGAIHWSRVSRVVFGVSQAMMREFIEDGDRISCQTLVNQGYKRISVDGPILAEEGRQLLRKYPLISKHEKRLRAASRGS